MEPIECSVKEAYNIGLEDAMNTAINGTFEQHEVTERTCNYVEVTPGGTAGRCSECGTMLHYQDNYCPNCGAKVIS